MFDKKLCFNCPVCGTNEHIGTFYETVKEGDTAYVRLDCEHTEQESGKTMIFTSGICDNIQEAYFKWNEQVMIYIVRDYDNKEKEYQDVITAQTDLIILENETRVKSYGVILELVMKSRHGVREYLKAIGVDPHDKVRFKEVNDEWSFAVKRRRIDYESINGDIKEEEIKKEDNREEQQ